MGIGGAGTKRFVRTGGRYGVGSALVLGCLVIGGAALAQEPRTEYRGTSAQQMACTPDVFRLCWSEVPDVGRIVACLKSNRAQLSSDCRAVFAPAASRFASRNTFRGRRHLTDEQRHARRLSSRHER